MAPVYLCSRLLPGQNAPLHFSSKNLDNLAPAALSSLAAVGVPHEREVSYMAYRENIDAFVAATNKKEKVFCSAEAFGRFKEDKPLPLSLPRVSFALAKALSDSQEKKMMTSLGDTSEKKKAGKITHYSFQPKFEQIPLIRSLEPLSNDSISVPRGHISLKGLLTFHTLSCIISEFLRVNTYPAFSKFPDDCGEFTFPLRKVGDDGTNYKGYTDAERKKRSFDLEEMSYVHKRRKMMETREEGDVNMDWEGPEEEADTSTIQGKVSTMLHDAVFTAKPSPCPHGTNIGTPNEAPTLPGLVFPYFAGMLVPDVAVLKQKSFDLLFRNLGSDRPACEIALRDLRRGYNSLAQTDEGIILGHLLVGVELALETQTRLFAFFDKTSYLGFSLLGARFSLYNGTSWVLPVTPEVLRHDLLSLHPHTNAISELCDILNALNLDSQYPRSVTPSDFHSLDATIGLLQKINISSLDDRDAREKELNRLVRQLDYSKGGKYRVVSPGTVETFLKRFFGSDLVELEEPFFIPSYNAPFSDKAFRLLAAFGPDAPSFWNTRGVETSIRVKEVDEKGVKKTDVTGYCPNPFLVSMKPLLVSLTDFKTVLQKKAVKVDQKERAKEYRNHSFSAETGGKVVWKVLVDNVPALKEVVEVKKTKAKEIAPPADFDDTFGNLFA